MRQPSRRASAPNQRDVLRAGADQGLAHRQVCPNIPLPVGGAVGVAIGTEAARLTERPRVSLVSLDAAVAGGVHGREVRIGDDHLMSEGFEVAGAPLAFGRGLDEDARRRPLGE